MVGAGVGIKVAVAVGAVGTTASVAGAVSSPKLTPQPPASSSTRMVRIFMAVAPAFVFAVFVLVADQAHS